MKRVLLNVCLLLAVLAAPCFADTATVNGVLAQERVVNLPNDQGKWYVSVVGDAGDAAYRRVLGWFEANANLKGLKNKVHFCSVASDTAIYQARYASNVKGLPTVRVQKPDGTVIYGASGKHLPMTAEGLYGAIASAVNSAQDIRPVLPWRREMERRCPRPGPCPTPNPMPQPDPEPQPIDDGGPPDLDSPVESVLPAWWVMLVALAVGSVAGVARKWRETYQQT